MKCHEAEYLHGHHGAAKAARVSKFSTENYAGRADTLLR